MLHDEKLMCTHIHGKSGDKVELKKMATEFYGYVMIKVRCMHYCT